MSPYPSQIDAETILATARDLIARDGLSKLSLSKLAAELGVKAPSLYRYFKNKADLLRAVRLDFLRAFTDQLLVAAESAGDDPALALRRLAEAYRAFAHAHPAIYLLAYDTRHTADPAYNAILEQLALPLQAKLARITGQADSLAALRGFWALAHGFVMLELNAQYQRGGSLDDAFAQAVTAYVTGWQTA